MIRSKKNVQKTARKASRQWEKASDSSRERAKIISEKSKRAIHKVKRKGINDSDY